MVQFFLQWLKPQKTAELLCGLRCFGACLCVCFIPGLWGAWTVPADYQQGEAFRIMFCHVPCAVLSLVCFVVLAGASAVYLIWRIRMYDFLARSCCEVGAVMCCLALMTGMIWGKPIWGTYWLWDARLTSEFILLCLYLIYLFMRHSILNTRRQRLVAAVFALIAVLDVPLVHYSVNWWFSLHQGSTFTQLSHSTIPWAMAWPMLFMGVAWVGYCIVVVSWRVHTFWQRDQLIRGYRGAVHVS